MTGCPDGVATLTVRKGAFDALIKGSGALGNPKGPKIQKIQDRPPGLKFSSEIENFKRTAHQTPIFFGEF